MRGAWEAGVEGRPASFSASGYAAYLWHDPDGGWALRVTDSLGQSRTVFSGFLTSIAGQFIDVTPVAAGSNDIVYQPNKHVVYFRFIDFGQVDGLNFGTECARAFTVDIRVGPPLAALSANEIFLGAGAVNPPMNPFRVQRARLFSASASG